jgi:CBS domain-containing membrane protein
VNLPPKQPSWYLPWRLSNSFHLSAKDKLWAILGAFVGIGITGFVSHVLLPAPTIVFLVGSMGAAAVLVFAVPHSPLSQPWPLIGGHLVSATIGVLVAMAIPNPLLAAPIAMGAAMAGMLALRCLHPPGGAIALLAVIGGDAVHQLGFEFIGVVALNAALLFVAAVGFNRLIAPGRYPAIAAGKSTSAQEWALGKARFSDADLDAALERLDGAVDISRDDLQRIFSLAVLEASRRRLGDVRARDIMRPVSFTFQYGDELEDAWQQMQVSNTKAVAVVDSFQRVIGIITTSDFVRSAARNKAPANTLSRTLTQLLQKTPGFSADKAEVVGQLMSSPAVVVKQEAHLIDLVDSVSASKIHYLPVLDDNKKLCGMVTRSEIMAALLVVRI